MNVFRSALLVLILSAGWAVGSDAPPASPSLPSDPVIEALPILQAKYIDFQALNYQPGDKLDDLIARSGGKISLRPPEMPSSLLPIITATLPDGTLYCRLASFEPAPGKSWSDLASQLAVANGTAPGIIFDLRSNMTPDDYVGAKQMLRILKPVPLSSKASPTVDDSRSELLIRPSPYVVLTNDRTAGAAEALAGFLQAQGALVVGRPTAGQAAVFQEDKLSSGQVLRYAVPFNASNDPTSAFKFRSEIPAWGRPIIPDIAVTVDDHTEKGALTLIKENDILDVIQEAPERHRMSEAALVHGQDPEWDDYAVSLERKPVLLSLPIMHDVVLIRALDSLKAIRLSQRPAPLPVTAQTQPTTPTSLQ